MAKSNFITIANMLGSSVQSIDDARQLLANTKRKWLLILDNADDPDNDYHRYFPSGTWGTIIMTSRVFDCSQYDTIGSETLTGLNEQESVNLLLKVAKIPLELWPSHKLAAEEVASRLGSHTLALVQAGTYIARGHCSMKEYPKEFQRQRDKLLKFKPKQAQSRYSDVFATFEASASVLESSPSTEAGDALCLLRVLSMLHFTELPMRIFGDAWKGSQEVRKISHDEKHALDRLYAWHLSQLPGFIAAEFDECNPFRLQEAGHLLASLFSISRSTQPGFLSMHSLVHAWARDRLSPKEQHQAWNTTGSILALSNYSHQMWQENWRQLRPHVHSNLNVLMKRMFSLEPVSTTTSILLQCGYFLLHIRDDKFLTRLLERIIEELHVDLKDASGSVELLPLHKLQAHNLRDLGKIEASVALFQKVVKIQATIQDETHPDRLKSQHALATVYEVNGQIEQAVQLLEYVVYIREITMSEYHSDLLASQFALAIAYKKKIRSSRLYSY